jgi:GNAT superfamily N-acetyltransferase
MIFREARLTDIKGMQIVRNAVRENRLSDPRVIADKDYLPFLGLAGKGWVCLADEEIVGFSFVDIVHRNVWALFVTPAFEKRGIGKTLHAMMLNWYFAQHSEPLWLSTAPNTRAETFYGKQGWVKTGLYGKGEIKFEITRESWATAGAGGLHKYH